jgi:hypothetical protein
MGITAIEMAEGLPPKAKMNPILAMKSVPKGFLFFLFLVWTLLIALVDPPPTLAEPDKHDSLFPTFLETCLVKDPTGNQSFLNNVFISSY